MCAVDRIKRREGGFEVGQRDITSVMNELEQDYDLQSSACANQRKFSLLKP